MFFEHQIRNCHGNQKQIMQEYANINNLFPLGYVSSVKEESINA